MDKNEFLATQVMGWECFKEWGDGSPIVSGLAYKAEEIEQIILYWNPSESIEQAFMLLHTFDFTRIYSDLGTHVVNIDQLDNGEVTRYEGLSDKSLPEAITEAVLKASGYEDG